MEQDFRARGSQELTRLSEWRGGVWECQRYGMKVTIIIVSDFVLKFIYSASGLALQVLGIFPSQAILRLLSCTIPEGAFP